MDQQGHACKWPLHRQAWGRAESFLTVWCLCLYCILSSRGSVTLGSGLAQSPQNPGQH